MSEKTTIAKWEESPYTSYDKRGITVQHRVQVARYEADSINVVHQRREGDGDWVAVRVVESRPHGMRKSKLREGVLQE